MKIKNAIEITDVLLNKTILDMESGNNKFTPSEYIFFVKDTSYDGDLNNKLSLIIIVKDKGYVVNNNLKFNSIEINERKISIYAIVKNKRQEYNYWFK